MTTHRGTWIVGATLALILAAGWNLAAAKPAKKPVDWAALNPGFAGATFVNDAQTCQTCHEADAKPYADTAHAKAFHLSPPAGAGECESCHGPRSKHIENPSRELALGGSAKAQTAVCLQCHEGGSRIGFKAGAHSTNDVSCTSCHTVMQQKSPRALLKAGNMTTNCVTCHLEVKAEGNKMSHHPVREGRMDCASCHNVHGAAPSLLVKNTLNDTCYTCHAEKRGPFVWEHAPARETCANCHSAHGSNQRSLLTSKDPFLCLSCHS